MPRRSGEMAKKTSLMELFVGTYLHVTNLSCYVPMITRQVFLLVEGLCPVTRAAPVPSRNRPGGRRRQARGWVGGGHKMALEAYRYRKKWCQEWQGSRVVVEGPV